MSHYPTVHPRPELPEEFRFLCILHNIGAIRPEKSLAINEIAKWTNKETSIILQHLQRLKELGYIELTKQDNVDKYHVSTMGIRKVLTLYS